MIGVPEGPFKRLLEVWDRLEIPYMVGGSAASGVHGLQRTTKDLDFIVLIRPEGVEVLVAQLQGEFYIDADQIRTAIRWRRSFNVIHFKSSYKFDIFPLTDDRYHQVQFARRRFETATVIGDEPIEFAVATPEDVILSKLAWYRQGGESSDTHWNDVLGVISVQGERLDLAYMREWAQYLKVDDLLERILAEKHEAF